MFTHCSAEMTSKVEVKRRPKKKSKNSRFLRNAKGFAKQGVYGRGTQIADDQYKYFFNILDTMKNGFEDVEDWTNMARNVFEETRNQEIHVASNQIVSKVLESLVGYLDADNLEHYFTTFADNFRPICSDRFASHVLQKLVEIGFLRGVVAEEQNALPNKRQKLDKLSEEQYNVNFDCSKEHRTACLRFVERVAKFLLNNLEDFLWDPCANHIMRTCILSLAGVHVAKKDLVRFGPDLAKDRQVHSVPKEWRELVLEFPQRLELWPQFPDFPYSEHVSPLLGIICISMRIVDKTALKHFGKRILDKSFILEEAVEETPADEAPHKVENDQSEATETKSPLDTKLLPKVFQHQTSVLLLETLLSVAGPKMLRCISETLFQGRMLELARGPHTYRAVGRLLQNFKERDVFESAFDELAEHTESLLNLGHTSVVEALAGACLRTGAKQSQMFATLQTALHVMGSDKQRSKFFLQCLLKLKPYEELNETANGKNAGAVHLHGSLIVQHLLKYNKPIFLVNCLLETPAHDLFAIFNTPNGSHMADAFMQSKFISEKSREKLVRLMEGFYIDLAVTKPGSRVVDRFFAGSQRQQQARIAKELNDKSNMLKGTAFGRLLFNKLCIETYRLSETQWHARLQQQQERENE